MSCFNVFVTDNAKYEEYKQKPSRDCEHQSLEATRSVKAENGSDSSDLEAKMNRRDRESKSYKKESRSSSHKHHKKKSSKKHRRRETSVSSSDSSHDRRRQRSRSRKEQKDRHGQQSNKKYIDKSTRR